jgi:hypothetical protein
VQELGFQWVYGVSENKKGRARPRLHLRPEMFQVQGIAAATACLLNLLFLRETRSDTLLAERASKLTKETGIRHVCKGSPVRNDWKGSLTSSLVRPLSTLLRAPCQYSSTLTCIWQSSSSPSRS